MKITIFPLAICFIFGWLAGWFGHWLWVDLSRRERKAHPPDQAPKAGCDCCTCEAARAAKQ